MADRDVLAELAEIGRDMATLRQRLPADSPFAGVAFKLHALIGQIEAEVRSNYDEKYDMAASDIPLGIDVDAVTAGPATQCEGSDSNRHGLPHQILSLAGPLSGPGSKEASEGSSATERHAATPIAAESTTRSTTSTEVPS